MPAPHCSSFLCKKMMDLWLRLTACGLLAINTAFAADLDSVSKEGERRVSDGAAAQRQVTDLADQAAAAIAEYSAVLKVNEGLAVYNQVLTRQVTAQRDELARIDGSMAEVALVERQIVPLMVSMLDALEQFIELDLPFLPEERSARIQRLRGLIDRADVTVAEKFRRVLEAYEVENEFGRTIEAYRGTLPLDGTTVAVDFLRVGRVALLYQSLDGTQTGAWDAENAGWGTLPAEQYRRATTTALKIARKQVAPELIWVPVAGPGEE